MQAILMALLGSAHLSIPALGLFGYALYLFTADQSDQAVVALLAGLSAMGVRVDWLKIFLPVTPPAPKPPPAEPNSGAAAPFLAAALMLGLAGTAVALPPALRPARPDAPAPCCPACDCGCAETGVCGCAAAPLPSEPACETCYRAADDDCRELLRRVEFVGGWRPWEWGNAVGKFEPGPWQAGGWPAVRLQGELTEAERVRRAWFAAWWVTWDRSTPGQRQEWAARLCDEVGPEAFWRGRLPLPRSLR